MGVKGETKDKQVDFPSAFSLFRPSFDAILLNVWTFLALFLLPIAGFIVVAMSATSIATLGDNPAKGGLLGVLLGVLVVAALIIGAAVPYVQLMSAKERQVTIEEAVRAGLKKFWRFYGLSLLTGLLIVVGLILFIVPGLFMMRRYILAPYYLFDRDLGVLEAMRQSAADSKRFSGAVWGLIGVNLLIGLTGIAPLFFIITAALQVAYYCAPAVRYLQIKTAAES